MSRFGPLQEPGEAKPTWSGVTPLDDILASGETYRLRYSGPRLMEWLRTLSMAVLFSVFGVTLPAVALAVLYLVVSPAEDAPLHEAGIVALVIIGWVVAETLFYFLLWRGRPAVVLERGRLLVDRGGLGEWAVLEPVTEPSVVGPAESGSLRFAGEGYDLEIRCGPDTAAVIAGRLDGPVAPSA